MTVKPASFFAPRAWINGRWADQVLMQTDASGHWQSIVPNAPVPRAHSNGIQILEGTVLPGVVNAHSHAFQRAIAGLTGGRAVVEGAGDDFWSWRDRMYRAALRITPAQLEAIATFLYAELLKGGYTQVCEFHYLHNGIDPSANTKGNAAPFEMAQALLRAARRVGIGLTLLPTLYMRSGFGAQGLRVDQQRFASTPESIGTLVHRISAEVEGDVRLNAGVAIHSLRAAEEGAIREMTAMARAQNLPIHIHVSEQTLEVDQCIAHTGARPIEWLDRLVRLDAHWNLVHATHANQAEIERVQRSGAAIVLCPSTEADLGDGIFDYSRFSADGGIWTIGSDSHVCRSWPQELRGLEYAQRLQLRQRNVALQTSTMNSCAGALFAGAATGARNATGRGLGQISLGHRADFVVLNEAADALLGVPLEHQLDALVFSSGEGGGAQHFRGTWVAGECVVADGRLVGGKDSATDQNTAVRDQWPQVVQEFCAAMSALWS